jgi:hypothetical protein
VIAHDRSALDRPALHGDRMTFAVIAHDRPATTTSAVMVCICRPAEHEREDRCYSK